MNKRYLADVYCIQASGKSAKCFEKKVGTKTL